MTAAKTELEQIQDLLMMMSLTRIHSKYASGVVAPGNHKALFYILDVPIGICQVWAGDRVGARGEQGRKDRKLLSSVSHLFSGLYSSLIRTQPVQPFTTQGFSYQGKPQLSGCRQKSRPAVGGAFLKSSPVRKSAGGSSSSDVQGQLALELTQNAQSKLGDSRNHFQQALRWRTVHFLSSKKLEANFHTLGTGSL